MKSSAPPSSRNRADTFWLAVVVPLLITSSVRGDDTYRSASDGPLTPTKSMALHEIVPGWTMELVASEPNVVDPVAVTWDERGRLFVAEMRDYPTGEGGGTVRLLEDLDHDGVMETSTIFAENLRFPNGLVPWRGGILVTSAPDLLFLKDSNGDGRADIRETILTGFGEGNQQLRVNGPVWGIDNWVYLANGRSGGKIRSASAPESAAIAIDRHDVRFRPGSDDVQIASGFSQFGSAVDAWGNRFINWNTVPFRHVVFPHDALERAAWFSLPNDCQVLDDPVVGNHIFPRSGRPATFNKEPAGYFNASCGIAVDRGGLWPAPDAGSAFVAEPLFNIVHRRLLRPSGSTFEAVRPPGEQDREFLASRDPWFRPVFCASGPDGCLYVADFYREWVEHPDFVRPELRGGVTWNTGTDFGRIYRIRPIGTKPTEIKDLSTASLDELVSQLDDSNGWCRDTARRLLLETSPNGSAERIIERLPSMTPLGRANAYSVLIERGPLPSETIQALGSESDGRVLAVVLDLARQKGIVASLDDTQLQRYAGSANTRLRFEVALASALLNADKRVPVLSRVASVSPADHWLDEAIVCSAAETSVELLAAIAKENPGTTDSRFLSLLSSLAKAVGTRRVAEEQRRFNEWIDSIQGGSPHLSLMAVAGYVAGLTESGEPLPEKLGGKPIEDWFARHRELAVRDSADVRSREAAISFIAHDPEAASTKVLSSIVGSDQPVELRRAALRALRTRTDPDVGRMVLASWAAATPSVKREILDVVLARPERIDALADAMEEGTVTPSELDPDSRRRVLENAPEGRKTALDAMLSSKSSADRSTVIREWREKLPPKGDMGNGKGVFVKNCAGCHQIGDIGTKVGPDIAGLISKSRDQVLEEILDPNRQILPDYVAFQVVTADGIVVNGLLVSEGSNSVTLRRAEGGEEVIPRSQIEEFRSTGRSLMPEGFEQSLSPQDFADLIAFLRQTP